MSMQQLVVLGLTFLGGGGVAAIIVKALNRGIDNADASERRANSNKTEVETLRQIIGEVRDSESRKTERIDALETRLDKLEERERHMLTRAAVHEAWDQLAFNYIAAQDTNFPHPPPLSPTDGL